MERNSVAGRRRMLIVLGLTLVVVGITAGRAPDVIQILQRLADPGKNPLRGGVDSTECNAQASAFATEPKRIGFLRDCMRRYRIIRAIAPEVTRLAVLQMAIPEYHDEQRFAASANAFGPMVMAFASPTLEGFTDPGQYQEHGARGVLSAVIYVDTLPLDAVLPVSYSRLGLRPGMNCLWISSANDGDVWDARMSRVRLADEGCDESDQSIDLGLIRTLPREPRNQLADVPTTARFTRERDGSPLIGIKCLAGWCDVGPQQPDRSPAFLGRPLAPTVTTLGGMAAMNTPGWYDEQVLARHNAATGDIRPGTIRASLVPTSVRYQAPSTFSGTSGVHVAILWLHDDPAGTEYAGPAWNLRAGRNDILLRESGGRWYMDVRNSGGVFPLRSMMRHAHVDAAVIPTARFRWASTDDGIWVGCGQACCRADGEM